MNNGNHKPTVTRHIKFDLELDSAMREIAEREQRSLHNLTRLLLREAIAARQRHSPALSEPLGSRMLAGYEGNDPALNRAE